MESLSKDWRAIHLLQDFFVDISCASAVIAPKMKKTKGPLGTSIWFHISWFTGLYFLNEKA